MRHLRRLLKPGFAVRIALRRILLRLLCDGLADSDPDAFRHRLAVHLDVAEDAAGAGARSSGRQQQSAQYNLVATIAIPNVAERLRSAPRRAFRFGTTYQLLHRAPSGSGSGIPCVERTAAETARSTVITLIFVDRACGPPSWS